MGPVASLSGRLAASASPPGCFAKPVTVRLPSKPFLIGGIFGHTLAEPWNDPAMTLSEYLKPALAEWRFFAVLAGGYYWFEHRPQPEEKETAGEALVVVTKSTNACFSDLVRATGYVVPRREAVVGADQEGSKVTDLFVREGDMVTDNQELARLSAAPQQPGASARPDRGRSPCVRRAPAS